MSVERAIVTGVLAILLLVAIYLLIRVLGGF